MNPLKIYICFFSEEAGCKTKVFRDIATLRSAWDNDFKSAPWTFSIVHVGYDLPEYEVASITEAIQKHVLISRPVLLSEAAKWSLPSLYSTCSSSPISYCHFHNRDESCPLYLALKEWDYEHEDVRLNGHARPKHRTSSYKKEDAKGWIADLYEDDEETAEQLFSCGISNDDEFLSVRDDLEKEILYKADNYRFEKLQKYTTPDDPFSILKIAPKWLLECSIEQIELSVRVTNVFKREGVESLQDLIDKFTLIDLLRRQNMGRKSVSTLTESIINAYSDNRTNPAMMSLEHSISPSDTLFDNQGLEAIPLHSHIAKALNDLPDNATKILTARLGFDGNKPLTLQQLGEMFGVTRERIRQIEKKHLNRVIQRELWDDLLTYKVENLLEIKSSPLFLEMLGVEDPWFEGFEDKPECLEEILTRFSEGKIQVVHFENNKILSLLEQKAFDSVIKNIKDTVYSKVDASWSKDKTSDYIKTELLAHRIENLFPMVWEHVSENMHFAKTPDGEEILTGVGRSADNLVMIVLEEADQPLHYSEIHKRVLAIGDRNVDIRRVQSALVTNPSAKLYDRGTYGTLKHLPYSNEIKEEILSFAEEIVSEGPQEKQWHLSEILEKMAEEDLSIPSEITTYEMAIILDKSDELICLGKNIWVSKHQEGLTNYDRIQAMDAFITILERAGTPLKTKELKRRVSEYRGISAAMQISPNDVLIRTSSDSWGLINRDIPLSKEQIYDALNLIHDRLNANRKGGHISEIKDFLIQDGFAYPEDMDPYVFLSLCHLDKRLKVHYGHLIALASWNSPRRENISSSFKKAYADVGPTFTLDEIHQRVQFYLERKIDRIKISNAISTSDAIYDKEREVWDKPKTEQNQEDEGDDNGEMYYAVASAQGG
jgi:hypothetical protein